MKIFPGRSTMKGATSPRRAAMTMLGIVLFGATGTLLVKAADNPEILKVMREFNRPIRQAAEPILPRPQAQFTRTYYGTAPAQIHPLVYAPRPERLQPLPRALPEPALQRRAEPIADPRFLPHGDKPRARRTLQARASGTGLNTPMNYCVRLCDGFAFPVGEAGSGQAAQEAACRSACPGAPTALYSAPAGAKDLDALSRGGSPYTALPMAFRYRETLTPQCTCRPVGATASTSALLTDMTLRRGDVVMTRVGARHFDGAARLPYRPAHFSDALAKLTIRKEIEIVRAMEIASVRGVIPVNGSADLKARIAGGVKQAEQNAFRAQAAAPQAGYPRGFVELQARERRGPVAMPIVKRAPGLVAMN